MTASSRPIESTRLPIITPDTLRGAEAAAAAESAAAFWAARLADSSDPPQPPISAAATIKPDLAREIWDMASLPVR